MPSRCTCHVLLLAYCIEFMGKIFGFSTFYTVEGGYAHSAMLYAGKVLILTLGWLASLHFLHLMYLNNK